MRTYSLILVLFLQNSSAEKRDTYTAAVVEYFPIRNFSLTPTERVFANVDKYVEILKSIKQPLDIVVFPESTLTYGSFLAKRDVLLKSTTIVPSGTSNTSPCHSNVYEQFLTTLSCAAIKYNTYLSVNLMEREKCRDDCKHDDKWNVYNTIVVFDREGKVVARYRKFNLFGEKELDRTTKAERVRFQTDFGVEFGIFTCFDIMFEDPAMKLVHDGVKHFLFSNMWFSELNQLTSLQTQQFWSYGNNVVLLAAGANNPRSASGGSGIFQGRLGSLEDYISDQEGNKVLIQEVQKRWDGDVCPKKVENARPSMEHFNFWRENYENYTSILVRVEDEGFSICNDAGDVCCNFSISITDKGSLSENKYHYHVAMLSGFRSFYHHAGGIDSCILIACLDEELSSCGQRSKDGAVFPFTFTNISVSIEAPEEERRYHYPNSLTGDFVPLHSSEFHWKEEILRKGRARKTITLQESNSDIFTFGIFGRNINNE